jgi:hypothetical protein
MNDWLEIWEPQPPGTLRASSGMYRDDFTFDCNPLKGNLPWIPDLEIPTFKPIQTQTYLSHEGNLSMKSQISVKSLSVILHGSEVLIKN